MWKYKYLRVTDSEMMWLKYDMTRKYFLSAVASGDALINLEDMTYYDRDRNEWLGIGGDDPVENSEDKDE